MRASQLHSTSFPAYPSVRISTVFQHCRRAFLLCSSTQCCTQCTHCYCTPALCACTSTIFKHFSGCIYTRLYVLICMCMCLDASTVKIFPKWVHARLLSANVHKHFHVCVHFYFVCISIVIQHFFFACISIVLQHFFYAYFLCISTLLHISTV